jgi:HlyD family secretion protein
MVSSTSSPGLVGALRRHAVPIAVAVGLLLLAAVVLPGLLLGPQVPVVQVVQRDFVQSLVYSGRVETPHRMALGVQVAGTVIRVPVAEGDRVAAADVLFELDAAELRAAVAQADAGVLQALARVRQVHEVQAPVAEQSMNQAQAQQHVAQQGLARSRELFAKGFIGQAALDEAVRADRAAQAQLRSAQSLHASTAGNGSDSAAAQAALALARSAATAARARLDHATVRAPAAGVVIARHVEPGDMVQPGRILMTVSPLGELQLVAQVDERHLAMLRPGLRARASADAFESLRFDAEVAFINPGVDPQRGSVEVRLRVPEPPPYLRQDMTVSVDIEAARRANATMLPADALRGSHAQPWVWVVQAQRIERRPVRIGLKSGGWAEVLGGLVPGDLVVPEGVPVPPAGTRVRAGLAAAAPAP